MIIPNVNRSEHEILYDIQWDHSNFTMVCLGGKIRFTPEFLEDIASFYGIEQKDILSFVKDTLEKTGFDDEVDIVISLQKSFFPEKESVFSLSVVAAKNHGHELRRVYLSSEPVRKGFLAESEEK